MHPLPPPEKNTVCATAATCVMLTRDLYRRDGQNVKRFRYTCGGSGTRARRVG